MATFHLIVGSVMGTALEVAQAIDEELEEHDHEVVLNTAYKAGDLSKHKAALTLIVTSTTGVGDLPENIAPLYRELWDTPPNIAGSKYALVSLGDSSYPDFAAAGTKLDHVMADIGAVRVGDPFVLDALLTDSPADDAQTWVNQWLTEHKTELETL